MGRIKLHLIFLKNAPSSPFRFLGTLHVLFSDSITPISCNPTKIITTPNNKYHSLPPEVKNLPTKEEITPKEVNVIIIPKEKNKEYLKAVFCHFYHIYLHNLLLKEVRKVYKD